jgi:hypothetical protein
MPEFYEIKIKGQIDAAWSDWFENMQINLLQEGDTLLSGSLVDQSMLHGLLERIRDLNLELLSVSKVSDDANQNDK